MTNQIGNGTAQGLIEYLDQLMEKGKASPGSIVPLKSTLKQVFSTVSGEENWKSINIREVDMENYIEEFKQLTIGKYAPPSYTVYLSRLNKIKDWYTKFLFNPGWAPKAEANGKLKRIKNKPNISEIPTQISKNIDTNKVEKPVNNVLNDLITYPFPLREGKIVYLSLPLDLTSTEAGRLGKFLESVSVDKKD